MCEYERVHFEFSASVEKFVSYEFTKFNYDWMYKQEHALNTRFSAFCEGTFLRVDSHKSLPEAFI